MAIDASLVFYTGLPLTYISTTDGQDLKTILGNINTAVNSMSAAPDYTGYNLYCITQTDGSTHPTNTQNFAEGISKIVCDNETTVTTFIGTTYVADQAVIVAAINAIQAPGLSYTNTAGGSTITITSAMTLNQVLTATYTGIGTLQNLLGAPGNTWATLAVTTPTNLSAAFNAIITYLSTLTTTVSGKQAQIGTYDNSVNCLAGTDVDTIAQTVTLLTTYVCALPDYDASTVTWLGVSAGIDLQTSIQTLVNTVSSILTQSVVDAGTGLIETAVGSTYQGKKLSVDTSYTQLYKVMVTGDVYTDADVLDQKISSNDGSIIFTIASNKLDMSVGNPATNKVQVDGSDPSPDYLYNKIAGGVDSNWGLSISTSVINSDTQLLVTPTISNPNLTFQSMMDFIASDPTLLIQFANLVAISGTVPGAPITDLVVTLTTGDFILTWTAQSGNSQQAKWRPRSTALWFTTVLMPANPLSSVAVTTTYPSAPVNDPQQFQVDTIYSSGLIGSNIYEAICYDCQSISTGVLAGVISVNQGVLPTISYLEYNLYNSAVVLQQTIITTGSSPAVAFNAVGADTYSITWRMGAIINGTILYSNDPSQLNAMCSQGGVVVP